MVTFSPDHSAAVGLAIFSGFAFLNALVLLVASTLVYPAGRRWPAVAPRRPVRRRGIGRRHRAAPHDHRCSSSSSSPGRSRAGSSRRSRARAALRELAGRIQTADAARSESRDGLTDRHPHAGARPRAAARADAVRPAVHDRRRRRDIHPHRHHHRRRHLRRLRRDRRRLPRDRGVLAAQGASPARHDRGPPRRAVAGQSRTRRPCSRRASARDDKKGPA